MKWVTTWLVGLISASYLSPAFAGRIIQVDRVIALEKGADDLTDYVIDMGADQGVGPGTWLDVYRRRPVTDLNTFDHKSDLKIWVGQLQVIHAQADMAVGRLRGISNPHDEPVLEYALPMTGDIAEIGHARVPRSIKTERVPGIIQLKRAGGKISLESDAKNYLKRVVRYLQNHRTSIREVHFVGASRDVAGVVAQHLRKSFGNHAPTMRYIPSSGEGFKSNSVVILVKRV